MKKSVQALTLIILVSMSVACSSKKNEVKVDETPRVKVARAEIRPVDQTEEYTATVESDVKNNIMPQSYLRIEKIFVEVGDRVSKGQILVQLDATNLRQLRLQIENQKVEFNRIDQLYKVGGASKAEWDNAKMDLDVKETQYRNYLVNTQLRSPISGIVTARNYDNGDMTGANPVLVIEQISPVKLMINVSEPRFPLIKKGMPVDIKLDTYGDELFKGKVYIIYPTIDSNTHTFPVEIRIANNDQRVRPGMFGRVTVSYGSENHVIVPDEAVIKQIGAGDHYVYVLKEGNIVTYNKVKLGQRLGKEYEILDGVPAGSQVVVAGQTKLADGVKVDIVK